ncbi:MAG TPA: DUF4956 domain-containing protein [Candidatus Dwaynia gallinarum]|nr:DUF4956 domain-containing protein [Candidatus Dwaynia gallinarum]
MLVALALGVVIALIYMFRSVYNKGFVITLALMPAVIQMVIMLVNGNLGTGVAVTGAFSLVRFRSAPGTAKEIISIFLAMAVGLATGMGYIGLAVFFVIVMGIASIVLNLSNFGSSNSSEKSLRITIPESLDYGSIFEDVFEKYLRKWELVQVRTMNMGSLFRLEYRITVKNVIQEKQMIDDLRCRNGNLEILCGRVSSSKEEL